MTFNLTTFVLEIVNFLVLLWLLQRFLYKPVLNAIAKRQQLIQSQIDEASSKQSEARQLRQQYEQRLEEWDKEKATLRSALRAELQDERDKQLVKIRAEIENEQKRAGALVERRLQDERRKCEQSALGLAADFTAKVLRDLASPELEKKICDVFLRDLHTQIGDGKHIGNGKGETPPVVEVFTVYPLITEKRSEIEKDLDNLVGSQCAYKYSRDPQLIAGIKVVIGGTILQANLQDAVTFFREMEKDGS